MKSKELKCCRMPGHVIWRLDQVQVFDVSMFPQSCIYGTVIQIQESDSIHPACQRYRKTICSWTRFAANLFFERPENKEIHQDFALLVSIARLIEKTFHHLLEMIKIGGFSRLYPSKMSSDFADQYQWCFAAGICFRICHEIEKDHLLN